MSLRIDSFDAFCRQYLPALERYLVCEAQDSGRAPAIAQECLLVARGRWDDLLAAGRADRWLFETATRELRRLEMRAGGQCRGRPGEAGLAVSDLLIRANMDGWVCDHLDVIVAVRSLPRRQAEVIGLHYLVEYSIDEVAQMLGICVGTAMTQLDRGLASLARAVTEDDLRVAGATIGAMPDGDLNRRLRSLEGSFGQRQRGFVAVVGTEPGPRHRSHAVVAVCA